MHTNIFGFYFCIIYCAIYLLWVFFASFGLFILSAGLSGFLFFLYLLSADGKFPVLLMVLCTWLEHSMCCITSLSLYYSDFVFVSCHVWTISFSCFWANVCVCAHVHVCVCTRVCVCVCEINSCFHMYSIMCLHPEVRKWVSIVLLNTA